MSGLELLAWEAPGWGAALAAGLLKSVLIALGAFGLGLMIGIGGAPMASFTAGRSCVISWRSIRRLSGRCRS
jgi:ABC-type arginine transport system permease subunit